MTRTAPPAIDPHIVPAFGTARNGQALSYNRAPAPDLASWIARLSVAKVRLPDSYRLSCGLFSDTPSVRVQLAGEWNHEIAGEPQPPGRALLFGPHTRLMPVQVRGSFVSIGVSLRPSACTALMGAGAVAQCVDRILPIVSLSEEHLLSILPPNASPEEWLCAMEDLARDWIARFTRTDPEPITARFEEIAFRDPCISIAQAAREIGVDRRRLERLVVRDFGMPPKQVLKRARALDMASYLRGVADDEEAEAMALRYYDESHLIREFVELFGMSPRQFTTVAQPLLTFTLEARQARRLETINRLAPGAKRPWQ